MLDAGLNALDGSASGDSAEQEEGERDFHGPYQSQ
jgi:hypothetical protein